MKMNILVWMGIVAVVWIIGSSGQLFAGTAPVGDYTLTVTEGDPSTDPKEAKVPRGKTSKMFFVVDLEDNTETNDEATYPEIDKIIYTVTIEPGNSAGFRYKTETDVTAKLNEKSVTFEERISDGIAIHTLETDGEIYTDITVVLDNTLRGTNTATLSVTVYPEEGDPISANHSISVDGHECSASAFVIKGEIKKNLEGKYVWDLNKIRFFRRKYFIGHAMWKVEIPNDMKASLTSDEKKTDWFKEYNNEQVGFDASDETVDQPAIQIAQDTMYQTGNFNGFSVQGKLSDDSDGTEIGKHGITLDQAKAGLQFIERNFGRQGQYGPQNNCVNMAVSGLNAAGVNRGAIEREYIRVIYNYPSNTKHENGRIDLSLPNDFATRYATPK